MDQLKLELEPGAAQAEVWVVEFRHPHFGWLDYDRRYSTKLDALDAMKCKGTAYPLRVRREA